MSLKLDSSEVIGALEYLKHQYPEHEEAYLRAILAVHELAIAGALTVKEWSEKNAALHERRAEAIFKELNPDA